MKRPFLRSLRPGQIRADETADIRDESELYLELRTEELVEAGMDPESARRLAEERFGDSGRIEAELTSQAKRLRARKGMKTMMGGFLQDAGYALGRCAGAPASRPSPF